MEAGLLPDGIFVSPAFLSRMGEGMAGGERQEWDAESGGTMLKVPKVESLSADDDLHVADARAPWEMDYMTLKCLAPGSHRLPRMHYSLAPCVDPREKMQSGAELGHVRSVPAASMSFAAPHPAFCHPQPADLSSIDQQALQSERSAPRQGIPPSMRSRVRRKGISERIRLLAKLMPWDRKMNTSTMLEEARSYVKFLEAQVTVLQCMPTESRFSCPPPSSYGASASVLRGLERLTRQQLLHVLVRSPLVQDKLCGRGLCVFSAEQVILMRQAAERKKIFQQQQQQQQQHHQQLLEQQMFLDSGSTSTISD